MITCKCTVKDEEGNTLFTKGKDYEIQESNVEKFALWGDDGDLYWFPKALDANTRSIASMTFELEHLLDEIKGG